eukprot:scaffold63_cov306-Pinguiococcus_pyrenoidosus.AAC.22
MSRNLRPSKWVLCELACASVPSSCASIPPWSPFGRGDVRSCVRRRLLRKSSAPAMSLEAVMVFTMRRARSSTASRSLSLFAPLARVTSFAPARRTSCRRARSLSSFSSGWKARNFFRVCFRTFDSTDL